jgi:hypothetical protein
VGICAEVGTGAYIDYARVGGSKNTLDFTVQELYKGTSGGFFVQDIYNTLKQDTTITIPSGATVADIQNVFDDYSNMNLNGFELRIIIPDGTYILDSPFIVKNMNGGYLRIYGNSTDWAGVEEKSVIFKPSDSWALASGQPDDINDMGGLLSIYNCEKVTVRYIQFESNNGASRSIYANGIESKNHSYVFVYANTFTGDKHANNKFAVSNETGGEMLLVQNFVGGWRTAFASKRLAKSIASKNEPTTLASDNSVLISALVDYGASFDYNLDDTYGNTLIYTGNELYKELHGGFFVQDVGTSPSYSSSFVESDLSSGVLTVTHNLDEQFIDVQIVDNNNKLAKPDSITYIDDSTVSIDLSSYGVLTDTWNLKIRK